jgi:hypothetical protein
MIEPSPYEFSYISIVIGGGYTEQVLHEGELVEKSYGLGSIIFHGRRTAHRISAIRPGTKTLFFALYHGDWTLIAHQDIVVHGYHDLPDGIYLHGHRWRKRAEGRWYTIQRTIKEAKASTKLSIFQNIDPDEVLYGHALDSSK